MSFSDANAMKLGDVNLIKTARDDLLTYWPSHNVFTLFKTSADCCQLLLLVQFTLPNVSKPISFVASMLAVWIGH